MVGAPLITTTKLRYAVSRVFPACRRHHLALVETMYVGPEQATPRCFLCGGSVAVKSTVPTSTTETRAQRAQRLGISLGTLRVRLHRERARRQRDLHV